MRQIEAELMNTFNEEMKVLYCKAKSFFREMASLDNREIIDTISECKCTKCTNEISAIVLNMILSAAKEIAEYEVDEEMYEEILQFIKE